MESTSRLLVIKIREESLHKGQPLLEEMEKL
jgi:hypothetical protein